jgi:hypothetical protein
LSAAPAVADGGEGDRRESAPGVEPLAGVVFALLVLACLLAFFLTQRLKHTPTVVQRFELTPRFAPRTAGPLAQEAISFKLARADRVTVAIEDATGDVVATLVRDYPVARYKQFSLRWNGRVGHSRRTHLTHTAAGHEILVVLSSGRLAPPGEYRVRVTLRAQARTVRSPRVFTLMGR